MMTWVEGGAELVALRPKHWLAFAAGALIFAAIPFPGWLMDALAPLGLLVGLRIAGRSEGEEYTPQ